MFGWSRVARAVIVIASIASVSTGSVGLAATGTVSRYVTVNGRHMFYECSGHGHPTVVLDAGALDTSSTWRWVQPQIARHTRVCAYDRAGLGKSQSPPAGHRTPRTQVDELHRMLTSARIPGPYIVVGHSWGGLLARLFAFVYPSETAGVVLLDATTFPYLTPAALGHLRRKTTPEGIDLRAAVAQSNAIKSLGGLPLIVLGSNKPPLDAKFVHAQDAEAALSRDSIDAIARHSTHYIQRPAPAGQPQVVITAATAVIKAARTKKTLPSCSGLFPPSAVICR